MRSRSFSPMRRGVVPAIALLVLSVVRPPGAAAEVVDPGDLSIYATASGGALTTDFAFAPSEVFQGTCLGGFCLYSATDPGFITRSEAPAGMVALASGTSVTMEIVSIADEASVLVGSKLLDAAGESAPLGAAPGLHLHPTWQVTIPAAGAPSSTFPVVFRLTAPGYAASQTYALTLYVAGQGPTPSPAPTASPKPTASPSPSAAPTAAPTASPGPSATPVPTSATPAPTASARPTATATPTPGPAATPTATPKPTATSATTARPSVTPRPTATAAATASPEPTVDLPPTPSPRPSVTATARATTTPATPTPSPSPRPTAAPTATAALTTTPRPTATPRGTASPGVTPSPAPPTPVVPEAVAPRSRGDQLLAYFDARDGFTSFVNVANTGEQPLLVRIDLRGADLRPVLSWSELLGAQATRTIDVGALRDSGLAAEPGLAVVTAIEDAGAAIASDALAGNFTVASLRLGSAWGAPAIARRAHLAATGGAAPVGTRVDGTNVVLAPLRPAAVELATYHAASTLERPELGGNQVIFVSFDDVAGALPDLAPAAMRWVVEAARHDGTVIEAAAVDTDGVEVAHLEELLGRDAVDASGRLELVARTPSADNRLVFFAQSLGSFATGYLLPPSR